MLSGCKVTGGGWIESTECDGKANFGFVAMMDDSCLPVIYTGKFNYHDKDAGVKMNGDRISWRAESGATSYNLYRAELGGSSLLIRYGDCRAAGITTTSYVDSQLPEPGSARAYLVTAVVSGSERGWGNESDGTARVVDQQCP